MGANACRCLDQKTPEHIIPSANKKNSIVKNNRSKRFLVILQIFSLKWLILTSLLTSQQAQKSEQQATSVWIRIMQQINLTSLTSHRLINKYFFHRF